MTFAEFVGNERAVAVLRRMLTSGRLPSALLFAGQKGVGKFTLAALLARAANCERQTGDPCDTCQTCRALAPLDALAEMERAAREARGNANPDAVPLILRPHPNVAVLVPDGAYIRVSQMRYVVRQAYTLPAGRGHNLFLIDQAERLRFDYADVLLKVLEEPAEHTTLVLITSAPFELRPTIRSRCIPLFFAPLSREEIETYLKAHKPAWKKPERELAAGVAAGSLGTALNLDLDFYCQLRKEALEVLRTAVHPGASRAPLFSATAILAGKGLPSGTDTGDSRKSFEFSLDVLYNLVADILYSKAETPDLGFHNPDLRSELHRLSAQVTWQWLQHAVSQLDRMEAWQRRNVNRQLALDAWALGRGPDS